MGRVPDELIRLITHDVGQVWSGLPFREIESLTREALPVIELFAGHLISHAEFSDEAYVIAGPFKLVPVCLLHLFGAEGSLEIVDAVRARVLTKHDARTAGATDWRCAEVVFKRNT